MKIYCLIEAINESITMDVFTDYFLTLEEGEKSFLDRYTKLGDDYTTLYLDELDTDTMTTERKMMFEGNYDEEEEDEDESDDE